MTQLDDKILPKVVSVLAKYGIDATLTLKTGDYDPTLGDAESGETSVTVKMSPPQAIRKLVQDDSFQEGDTEAVIAASGLTITPETDMLVTAGGETWHTVGVDKIYSGAQVAAYSLHLRQ